jgi:predicted nuclease of predicted toxin-antitoxin system
MKFLVDAQLPPGLCLRLRQLGHEAIHVSEMGLNGATDAEIAAVAVAENMILITKDEDFLALRRPDRFAMLWLRCGNITNQGLTAWLEPLWQDVEHLLEAGERLIELR